MVSPASALVREFKCTRTDQSLMPILAVSCVTILVDLGRQTGVVAATESRCWRVADGEANHRDLQAEGCCRRLREHSPASGRFRHEGHQSDRQRSTKRSSGPFKIKTNEDPLIWYDSRRTG
jgi:hypothetical protein